MIETIIYLRTSTEDQHPENQLKDCVSVAKFGEYEIIQEKESAWKDNVRRDGLNSITAKIKQNKLRHLIVWDLDRLFRNRKKLIAYFKFAKHYNCQIHSFRQQFFESINSMPEPWNEMVFDIMLQLMGWLAEDESKKKSLRVKAAVRKIEGQPTKSYKGKKWGRQSLSKRVIQQVLDLRNEGHSIREISKQVKYWDKNNNERQISKSAVHKILRKNIV